jgi:uncharacterized protein (DUF927 family)
VVCVFKDGWNNRGCDEETTPEEFGYFLIKRKIALAYNKRAGRRMRMRMGRRMNIVTMLGYRLGSAEARRDDLIFWLLFDQARSRIHYNNRKKNENENVKENEYKSDASLIEPLPGRRGKSSHRGSEDQKNFDWLTACEKCLHFRAKRGLFAMLSKRNFSRTASVRLDFLATF